MKKLLLGLLAVTFLLGGVCTARVDYEEKFKESFEKEEKQCKYCTPDTTCQKCTQKKMKRADKEKKKEEKLRDQEAQQEERSYRRSPEGKHERAVIRKQDREAKNLRYQKRREERHVAHAEKKLYKKETEHNKRIQCKQNYEQALHEEHLECENKAQDVRMERDDRRCKIDNWEAMSEQQYDQDVANGRYADVYKSPAWPIQALFYEDKDLFNVSAYYQYATDCYDSNRSGSKSDITKLAFGEDKITFDEILLASKLVTAGKLGDNGELAEIQRLADRELSFRGREESYGLNFEFSRYIFNEAIACGVEVPVLYRRHRLKVAIPIPDNGTINNDHDYRDSKFLLDRILLAKGITELGGSAAGLGDIAFFINGQFNSIWWDKLVVGIRFQFPTGKEASQNKLWAPDLGNGGFTEIQPFMSIIASHSRCFNPHMLSQVSFTLPAHVDRRVPQRRVHAANTQVGNPVNAPGDDIMAMGDRVVFNAEAFDEFDTTIKGFGDKVSTVKMRKGVDIKIRLGNIIECFMCERSFLDIFYDFRAKAKDRVSGISADFFNVEILRKHTNQLEHRIGFDYSYQPSLCTRLRLGMRYVFAGRNVPKTFEAVGSYNYAF